MNAVTLTLDFRQLRAMRTFTSSNDKRRSICGIHIMTRRTESLLMATDGKRAAFLLVDKADGQVAFTIPNDLLDRFIEQHRTQRVAVNRIGSVSLRLEGDPENRRMLDGTVYLNSKHVTNFMGRESEDAFPNWKGIVPTKNQRLSMGCFSISGIAHFNHVAEMLSDTWYGPWPVLAVPFSTPDGYGFEVYIKGVPNFYGLLMGHVGDRIERPEWLRDRLEFY